MSEQLPTITCVFDRTISDVNDVQYLREKMLAQTATAEEKARWATDLKGALNASDLTRIQTNMGIIAGMMGIRINNTPPGEIPNESYFASLLADLRTLYRTKFIRSDTPAIPESPLNTYQKWNDIERIQYDIFNTYLSNTGDNFNYLRRADGMYAGDDIVVI